jgi:hypothetical protein
MRSLVALAACAVVLFVAAPAVADGPRQVGSFQFTSTLPGTSTGTVLHVDFQNPTDPNAKPYALETMVIHGPAGSVTDTTVPPQCHATDAEIYLEGPAACPEDSQIGNGVAVSDQGPASPGNRYTRTDITDFNNEDEVVGIGVNEDIPAIKTIDRTQLDGPTSTSHFPLFPGAPPPEPYTPVKTLDISFPPYSRGGRAYHLAPPTCPAVGYWTFTLEFVYRDGVVQSFDSHSPCQA